MVGSKVAGPGVSFFGVYLCTCQTIAIKIKTLHKIESQRENQLMTVLFHFEYPGSATIEYFENGSDTPAFTKDIEWY